MSNTGLTNEPAPAPGVLELLSRALLAIATWLMLAIVALIVAQIAARNIWNIGLPRGDEMTRLAGVLCVYLTAPVLALKGQHVAVDVFTGMLPRLPRQLCAILAELSVIAFAGLSLWGGWLYLARAARFRTPALGLQNIWFYSPIMICLALLVVVSLWKIWSLAKPQGSGS